MEVSIMSYYHTMNPDEQRKVYEAEQKRFIVRRVASIVPLAVTSYIGGFGMIGNAFGCAKKLLKRDVAGAGAHLVKGAGLGLLGAASVVAARYIDKAAQKELEEIEKLDPDR